ncbi:MAG: DNA topoisomerase I [Candidatus Woesearchaeota archaeon]|nr:MAG: DNA topoisomerase I [Candidatus Woesearchaeota archaeon]
MGVELIIAEKPNAAQKLATALADTGSLKKQKTGTVTVYSLSHNKIPIKIVAAVGHLYTVTEKKKSFSYPSYAVEWKPTYLVDKEAAFTKKYLDVIKKEAEKASSFTVACDYDIEGEVIGLNIVKYACKQKDASRMKFSTLVKEDLIEAFNKRQKHLDWGQAHAGETRHVLDWLYGINISRALTNAVKRAGSFKVMSSGRVQGPALKMLVDKEKEIRAFKPKPFWQLELHAKKSSVNLVFSHEQDKFFAKKKADEILARCKGKPAVISSLKTSTHKVAVPLPFDLGSLQTESYRLFKIHPKETLQIAQTLYQEGVTSYPRTSSQELPPELGYKKILGKLAKQSAYEATATQLMNMQKLVPTKGSKKDPAHPAIHPTGEKPSSKLSDRDKKVYDLIVKRFFAVFGVPATREIKTVTATVEKENFITKGSLTVDQGWFALYAPYGKQKEEELPVLVEGESLKSPTVLQFEKETSPPKRYTASSVISELEKRNLGTKATRADIIDSLVKRGYVNQDGSLFATDFGIKTIELLEEFVPTIVDQELTRDFEEEMEGIRTKKVTPEKIISRAEKILTKTLDGFQDKELAIGKKLIEAHREQMDVESRIDTCPVCKKGMLRMMYSKKTRQRFIACDAYPDCKTILPVPQAGEIKSTGELCEHDAYPLITIRRKGKKPQKVCSNKECPANKVDLKEEKEMAKLIVEKECPKCQNPLVLRKSVYGEFLGCSNFPKCRYTERLKDGPLKEDFKGSSSSGSLAEKKSAPAKKSVPSKSAAPKKTVAKKKTTVRKKTAAKKK